MSTQGSSEFEQTASEFDYVTVGHVTVDVLAEDGTRRPGGGAFYSALQAARLGLRTLIVTRGEPRELEELLAPYSEELELRILPSEHTTTLATSGSGAARAQRLLAWAGPIEGPIDLDTKILHLAAVAQETPAHWRGRADFVGVTPQGLLRAWDAAGDISLVPLKPDSLPICFDAAVISQVERPGCEWLVEPTPEHPLAIVTAGADPIAVHALAGSAHYPPALGIASPRDDLGAGDVFAAACFVALAEGRATPAAVAYANAAAAVRIEGLGPGAVGTRDAIERRLSRA